MAYTNDRSSFWHPLSFKTMQDWRLTPYSMLAKFVVSEFKKVGPAATNCDPLWAENL